MHQENPLTREKTEEDVEQDQPTSPEVEDSPSTPSETDRESHLSTDNVHLVTFRPGEPANPHNWSKVSLMFSISFIRSLDTILTCW